MKLFATTFAVSFLSAVVNGHGLIENPPARNWLCGYLNKPHEVDVSSSCGEAYAYESSNNGGYQFMSVLTHDVGRAGVSPLPSNVCGFDSETWNGGATPWDAPIDWPVNHIPSGRNEFKWNISWGPHWDDTEEFRYYITKADFVFDPTKPLTWDDFEDTAFCSLEYNDKQPNANPGVETIKEQSWFITYCNVPSRGGHHVIYAEWGRNYFTYERFHGCIDVVVDSDGPSHPTPSTPTTVATTEPTVADPATSAPVPSPSRVQTVDCTIRYDGGRSPWYAGLRIGFETNQAVLDFTGTGLDLSALSIEPNNFGVDVHGQTITLTKPGWVSLSNLGYQGLHGNNVADLATASLPSCMPVR